MSVRHIGSSSSFCSQKTGEMATELALTTISDESEVDDVLLRLWEAATLYSILGRLSFFLFIPLKSHRAGSQPSHRPQLRRPVCQTSEHLESINIILQHFIEKHITSIPLLSSRERIPVLEVATMTFSCQDSAGTLHLLLPHAPSAIHPFVDAS